MSPQFPPELAAKILSRWNDHPHDPTLTATPSPALEVISELLNVCFFASLKTEEGRAIQFNLAFLPTAQIPDPSFRFSRYARSFNLVRFDKPRELSVNEIMRLAPACDPEKTIILASYDSESGHILLPGVVDVGRSSWLSGGTMEHQFLSELRVRAFGPGEMRITLKGHLFALYRDGAIHEPEIALMNSGCIYEFFRETTLKLAREVKAATVAPANEHADHERDYRAIPYLLVLQEIIERTQRLKHGGCILFAADPQIDSGLKIKYQCQNNELWNSLRGKLVADDLYFKEWHRTNDGGGDASAIDGLRGQRDDAAGYLNDALDMFVRFTAVDGAVLMNRDLEVFGFGAVVKISDNPEYEVFRCVDRAANQKKKVSIDSYGTRHRSAFEFCYRNSPAVAFVMSQDGGTKAIMRVGNDICFWEGAIFDFHTEV